MEETESKPSTLAIAHYELLETIGSGSFGKVKKAKHKITGHEGTRSNFLFDNKKVCKS